MLSSAVISVPSRRLTCSSRRGSRTRVAGKQEGLQGQLERPLPVRPTHQSERVLTERFIASPAQEIFGLRVPVPDNALRVDLDKASSAVSMMPRASCSLSRNVSCASRLSVMSADEEEALGRLGPCSEP